MTRDYGVAFWGWILLCERFALISVVLIGHCYGDGQAEFTEQPGSANGYASPEKDGRELSTAAPAPDLPQVAFFLSILCTEIWT